MVERFDAAEILAIIKKRNVTIFPMVPPVLLGLSGMQTSAAIFSPQCATCFAPPRQWRPPSPRK